MVRTVVGGGGRWIWRAGGVVVLVVIVEMGGGEDWRGEGLALVVYIVMAVHGGGGMVFCNLCTGSDPFGWLCTEIEMKIGGKKKKRRLEERRVNAI